MPLTLETNIAALSAQRALENNAEKVKQSSERLASGKRILRAGDDPSGAAISNRLEVELRSVQQARRNAMDASGVLQVAESGLGEVSNLALRLRELATQAASDTLDDDDRELLNTEAEQIKSEIDRLARTTTFNGLELLTGKSSQLTFMIGPDNNENNRLTFKTGDLDARTDSLGIHDVDLSSIDSASDAIDSIDQALKRIDTPRAKVGALMSRLNFATDQLSDKVEDISEASSRIADTDYASETSEMVKNQIRLQASAAVLSQANVTPQIALQLLRSI